MKIEHEKDKSTLSKGTFDIIAYNDTVEIKCVCKQVYLNIDTLEKFLNDYKENKYLLDKNNKL